MPEPGEDAHFTATFPSDTIAEVMEAHFNKSVFKQKVRVVDLRMQADMCMFSLVWVTQSPLEPTLLTPDIPDLTQAMRNGAARRDQKGRFATPRVVEE